LKELGGLYSLAAGVVSSDSGPMHIASALETRTVGLFGPSNPARTGPWNHLSEVVQSSVSCSPCRKRNCRRDECMREITPEAVFERLFAPFADAGKKRVENQ
jgi:ADP-heptose:LPS heptosyltransferase